MKDTVFTSADILLPVKELEKWSVIACDQFTSQPEYWQEVEGFVGSAPSSLHLIVPEVKLDQEDESAEAERISARMESLIKAGTLKQYDNSYIYLEREMQSGLLRCGIVGAVDLESYDYTPGSKCPVRATEETVESRLPARVAVRERAMLELPHIMLLMAENDRDAFEFAEQRKEKLEKVYDFELMAGGGHIRGWRITGEDAQNLKKYFIPGSGAKLIIGDGNHSLAAALKHWQRVKAALGPEAAKDHPARYCLAEVCGVWDEAIEFHPIHRVLFHADALELRKRLSAALGEGEGLSVVLITAGGRTDFQTAFCDAGSLTEAVQRVLDEYVLASGARLDYVHGDREAAELGAQPGSAAVIMPAMGRSELFAAANEGRIFPRKCFSIGAAREKRYYLEARKIVL